MFSLGMRYLMGWAMAAADGAKKERAEWPPHPDRVFMALAAAWFETGQDVKEGEALRWLETLPAPALAVSGAYPREVVTHYVPVNDTKLKSEAIQKLVSNTEANLSHLKEAGLAQLLEYRSRQPRTFPVAIPHHPDVHLIWQEDVPTVHRKALESLCRTVNAVGHSASVVQMWLEFAPPQPTLRPVEGITPHRLRVFGPGRLAYLERRMNRREWIDYHDLQARIEEAKEALRAMVLPARKPWDRFPDVFLLASESATKQHPDYRAAKSGDAASAARLVRDLATDTAMASVRRWIDTLPADMELGLVCAHAYEREGVNAIPAALAEYLSEQLGLPYEPGLVQVNVVAHTGADGYGRLARQACFDGKVKAGRAYVMVDDFIGQGGTLANLRGQILKGKGRVAGAVCLSGKPYSAKLALQKEQLDELRRIHGPTLEEWWRAHFGHAFDCLTQSEARYLARSPDADEIRNRIAEAKRAGGGAGGARSHGEQQSYLKRLESQLAERYPNGTPATRRPEPGLWQGYAAPPPKDMPAPTGSLFDPRLVVLALKGKRLTLPTCLKLTEALRGALLAACPKPIPEWVCGHQADGAPSREPHIAYLPLPFVGGEHADGRILGVALALPRAVSREEAGRVLAPLLYDEAGPPREIRLFDSQWLQCRAQLENRDPPPLNLRVETWTRPARTWASVTPVVLDRHFDGADKWAHAAETVKDACERVGLPRPLEVLLHPVSLHAGVPKSHEFPRIERRTDGGRRHHAHALIVFPEDVTGPVLVGAGRFRGYGLCRPVRQGG